MFCAELVEHYADCVSDDLRIPSCSRSHRTLGPYGYSSRTSERETPGMVVELSEKTVEIWQRNIIAHANVLAVRP